MEKLLDLLKTKGISESDLQTVKEAFDKKVADAVAEQSKLISEKADKYAEDRINEQVSKRVAEEKKLMEAITQKYCEKKALTIAKKADKKLAEKMQILENATKKYILEHFTVEFEKKYREELEQIEENTVNRLDQYVEAVLDEKISPKLIEQMAMNETCATAIKGIRSVLAEQFMDVDCSGKAQMAKLKNDKIELEESLKKQVNLNFDLKNSNKALQKAKIVAEACVGLSAREAERVRNYFEPKKLDETKSDLPGFVKMLKESAESMRHNDPMLTEKFKARKRPGLKVRIEDDTQDFVNEKLDAKAERMQEDEDSFLTSAANWA